jgi:hypothetical protein
MSDKNSPLLPTATALYLLGPTFLFACGWLRLPVAVVTILALAGCAGAVLVPLISWLRSPRPARTRPGWGLAIAYALAALLVIGWLLCSGAGGFGYQNDDYITSNALLKDLIQQDWPVTITFNQVTTPIVYYFAYYLPAALVGKLWGWTAANRFLFAWTAAGVGLALVWFVRIIRLRDMPRPVPMVMAVVMFCMAGGLDLVGYTSFFQHRLPALTDHIEFWAQYVQYSSQTTLLYWVPQQVIAIWLITGLVVNALLEPGDLGALGIALATGVIWSPFGLLGLGPYLLLLLAITLGPTRRAELLRPRTLLVIPLALWVALIHILFITANTGQFPKGFIWEFVNDHEKLAHTLGTFWWLEFGAVGLLALALLAGGVMSVMPEPASPGKVTPEHWRAALDSEFGLAPIQVLLLLISLVTLSLLLIYKAGTFNDLAMRASIPSLFILWATVTKILIDMSRRGRWQQGWLYGLLVVLIGLGSYASIEEINRSIAFYRWAPPAFSNVATSSTLDKQDFFKLQRMGDPQAPFFRYLGK